MFRKAFPYILLDVVFIGLLIAQTLTMSFLDIVLLGLAASFLGRAVAYLKIFEWLRVFFGDTVKHWTGGGEDIEPKPIEEVGYFRNAIAHLLLCPICAGTWAALTLTYLPDTFTYVFAASAIAWLMREVTEHYEWSKNTNRAAVGRLDYLRKELEND